MDAAFILLGTLVVLPALSFDVRNGLRYGRGTLDSGCAPGACGCAVVPAGALLGWAAGHAAWAALAGSAGVWLVHAVLWRIAAAMGSTRTASLRSARSADVLARSVAIERLSSREEARSDRDVRQAVLEGLDADELKVVIEAARGAMRIDAALVATESLRKHLLQERAWVVDAYWELGRSAVGPLLTLLEHGEGSGTARSIALHALGRIGDLKAVPVVRKALESADPALRSAAATACRTLPDASLHEPLRALLRDAVPSVRAAALDGLGHLKAIELGVAAAFLEDPDLDVRCRAASALGLLQKKEAVPLLVPLLRNERIELRRSANGALWGLDWTPSTDDDRAYHALAEEKWGDLAGMGDAGAQALLLATRDRVWPEKAVATLELMLKTSAGSLTPATLERLASLDGVEQGELRDLGYGKAVDCSRVRALARQLQGPAP